MELINILLLSHEGTDDAQMRKTWTPSFRVSGYVSKVYIKDNNFVKGDTLFTIDKKDYQLKIDETANLAAERILKFLKQTLIVFN
jgi:membrane fusion protein (multidrug efflux system)